MANYISREAAIEALCKAHSPYPRRREISVRAIQDISPADVRPVVHGRWIPMTYIKELTQNGWPNCRWEKAIEPDSVDGLMCSECGEIFDFADARNFCTQCGADMRGMKDCES